MAVAPPDMSTLAKARTYQRGFPWFVFDMFTQYQEQGPDYIAAYRRPATRRPPKGFAAAGGRATTTNISPAMSSPCRRRCRTGR